MDCEHLVSLFATYELVPEAEDRVRAGAGVLQEF
jgi:hypothetical protein